ncbi:MAG: flagellin [Deltaproteobacteria bacterium]|nr:flagellin [Deltaproteobacteria bacterium]
MANQISLTSGMRNNLLSLQGTSKMIDQTQTRLSTGKKVNSPLDNPTNYFASQSHLQRADDLSARKDGMAEAVQMVKAADAGMKAITSLIESAKGVAQAALASGSTTDREAYAKTFDTLMTQVTQLASDSGYRGTNFLTGGSQTVEFSQATGTSTLGIEGFNATSEGLSISDAGSTWSSGVAATDTEKIQSSSSQLEGALNTLRGESSKLSSNMSVVTTRQDFTSTMINELKTGADNLTLADMNEEGANMLMLQTQQNLGVTSLSMASQSAQAVMRLF